MSQRNVHSQIATATGKKVTNVINNCLMQHCSYVICYSKYILLFQYKINL